MLSKIDHEFHFLQTALDLRARRQEVLASNLANADTPNYKARDFNFQSALKAALGGSGGSLPLTVTSPRDIAGTGGAAGAGNVHLLYRAALQPSLDGNTVDSDVERANFADNAMHYQFILQAMTGKFHELAMVVSTTQP